MALTESAGVRVLAFSTATSLIPDDDLPSVAVRLVNQRAAQIAEQVGVGKATIERLPFDLSALEQDGILVNVDAKNFGLLDRRLDWQALGIARPRDTGVAFRPPRCGVVPDRYRLPLLRPAAQAHNALHRFSYSFRLIETVLETTAYRWVPWRGWGDRRRTTGRFGRRYWTRSASSPPTPSDDWPPPASQFRRSLRRSSSARYWLPCLRPSC